MLTNLITLSQPIILHPPHHSLLTLFPTTLQPSHSILPYPIPLHPMPSHPFNFTYPIPPCPIFHPTLSHSSCLIPPCPIPLYLIPSQPSYSTHPIPPHASSLPCHRTYSMALHLIPISCGHPWQPSPDGAALDRGMGPLVVEAT